MIRERKKLTQKVAETSLPKRGEAEVLDSEIPGFLIRVRKTSASWTYRARNRNGRLLVITLGRSDDKNDPRYMRADQARLKAEELRLEIRKGGLMDKEPEAEKIGFVDATERYLAQLTENGQLRTAARYRSMLLNIPESAHMRDKKLAEVTPKDVQLLRDRLYEAGKNSQSNDSMSIVSSLFRWACREPDLEIDVNPASSVGRRAPRSKPRSRVLSEIELKKFLEAIDSEKRLSKSLRYCIWLELLTGQRKGSVCQAKQEDFKDGLWTIPEESMKSGRLHVVPLPELVQKVVEAAKKHALEVGSDVWLFPSERYPDRHTAESAANNAIIRIRKKGSLDVAHFTPHDLRRSLATTCADYGIDESDVGKLLDHASGTTGVTVTQRVYIHSRYIEQKRSAIQKWCDVVQGLRDWSDVA